MGRLLALVSGIGADPRDSDDTRLRKTLLVAFAVYFAPVPVVWSSVYWAYGEVVPAAIPFAYSVFSLLATVAFHFTRRIGPFRESLLMLFAMLPLLLQLSLGGFAASGAVVMLAVIAPFGALVFGGVRHAAFWLAVFVTEVAIAAFVDPTVRRANALPAPVVTAFFALNIAALATIASTLIALFMSQKDAAMRLLARERERSESLLLNVLPREIAPRLKSGESPIADGYDAATVLFADIVGSTELTRRLVPRELVSLLDEVFSHFDDLVERHGVEKIRTIGDNYMAVGGVPVPRPDHAQAMARMALDIRDFVRSNERARSCGLDFRIGLNSGPLVAGVIGRRKFVFDVWGEPVNTASRMESHGIPGSIQLTQETYELISEDFVCERRQGVEVKGLGTVDTWLLMGPR